MDERREPGLRVGDDERRAVDTRLQRAHAEGRITLMEYDERSAQCWKATTRADLDVLTRDLPADAGAAPTPAGGADGPVRAGGADGPAPAGGVTRPARPHRSALSRFTGTVGTVAVLAVAGYAGFQVLGAADSRAVLGDVTVTAQPGQERLRVGMLLGDVDVVVPDGVRVSVSGTVLAGDVVCAAACGPAAAGERTLVVDASGALGDLRVLTATESAARSADDRDRGDR